MKLAELARRTGASTAAVKFWIREGLLPPGELRNQTTAVYGDAHVERIALIQTMRAEFDASTVQIRELTALIDLPAADPLEVMQACQLIATGLRDADGIEENFLEQVDEMIRRAGWPEIRSIAARALAGALAASARVGFVYDTDQLVQYAAALDPLARRDIGAIHPEATLDVLARNLLVASAAQNRMFAAMNQLAHTSIAVSRVGR